MPLLRRCAVDGGQPAGSTSSSSTRSSGRCCNGASLRCSAESLAVAWQWLVGRMSRVPPAMERCLNDHTPPPTEHRYPAGPDGRPATPSTRSALASPRRPSAGYGPAARTRRCGTKSRGTATSWWRSTRARYTVRQLLSQPWAIGDFIVDEAGRQAAGDGRLADAAARRAWTGAWWCSWWKATGGCNGDSDELPGMR